MTKLTVLIDGQCAVITLEADEVEINSPEGVTFKLPEQGAAGWPGLPGNPPGSGSSGVTPGSLFIPSTTGKNIDPEGVNHPKHDNNHPCGLEVIEVTDHLFSFNLGCVFKYVVRADSKDGLKDLKKAEWYTCQELLNHGWWSAREVLKKDGHRYAVLRNNLDSFRRHEPDALVKAVLDALNNLYFGTGKPEALLSAVTVLRTEREKRDAKKQDGK